MKKILILLLAVMLVPLAACGTDNLAEYKKAAEKTEQIHKGQFSAEFSMTMDYNTDELTAEEVKELNYFKDMKGTFSSVYDDEAEKAILRNYMNFGGLGFDFDMYINGEEIFMKLPVVGKFMKIDEIQNACNIDNIDDIETEEYSKEIVSDETIRAFTDKWVNLMNDDDVFKGRDIILTTPDGEVKTTEYTITLTGTQIRTMIEECADIAAKDEKLRQFCDNYMNIKFDEEEITFEEMLQYLKDNIEDYTVEDFKYTALVDIDGYIVNENIKFAVKAARGDLVLRGLNYNMDIITWDINKEQHFDFPELTDENTIDADNAEELPDLMKDMFEKRN
jgi:hypothetical protein